MNLYSELVKMFYRNLKVSNEVLKLSIGSRVIEITHALWLSLAGLSMNGMGRLWIELT